MLRFPIAQVFVGLSINQSSNFIDDDVPPTPPRISSEGITAVDITGRFFHAARSMIALSNFEMTAFTNQRIATALEPGQLVKDGYFTLFEAVGALEV